jgi:hypothetical protein
VTIHNEGIDVKAPGSNNDVPHRKIKNFSRVFDFLNMRLCPLESIKYKSKPALAVGFLSF